jgi:hypothetical protein
LGGERDEWVSGAESALKALYELAFKLHDTQISCYDFHQRMTQNRRKKTCKFPYSI